ncbi:MAG TPA: hypothetical protein VF710_14115 [Longimicrobium sp.]
MTIEVVSFLIGGILIGTAIVGGGFEIKEIKMPRVGAGVRIVSLVAGSGFVLLAMGIWGANNPHLLAQSQPGNAFMQTTATNAADPATQATPQAPEEAAPEAPSSEEGQPDPAFIGFTADTNLDWQIEGADYNASAHFAGMSGTVRVGWVDPTSGVQDEVIQDLVLQQDDAGMFYQGVNPRDPSTDQPRPEYRPDHFRVVKTEQGWTMDQVCDSEACWPLTIR